MAPVDVENRHDPRARCASLTHETGDAIEGSLSFYVYENRQAGAHKAVIHAGKCVFCNDGTRRVGGYDRSHAQWHPEHPPGFTTLEEARHFARTRRGVVKRQEHNCVARSQG